MRVVLDTNVVVSALISPGTAAAGAMFNGLRGIATIAAALPPVERSPTRQTTSCSRSPRQGRRTTPSGRAVIDACTSYAGAMLEKRAHAGRKIPIHQVCVTFEFPDDLRMAELSSDDMPGWDSHAAEVSRRIGDDRLFPRTS